LVDTLVGLIVYEHHACRHVVGHGVLGLRLVVDVLVGVLAAPVVRHGGHLDRVRVVQLVLEILNCLVDVAHVVG